MQDTDEVEGVHALVGVGWWRRGGWGMFNTKARGNTYPKGHETLNVHCFVMLESRMSKAEKCFMQSTRL